MSNPSRCCAYCKIDTKLEQCSACKYVLYCSKKCQKQHFKIHKLFCKDAFIFKNINRLCECCGKETDLGCKICRMSFCKKNDGECYTRYNDIHKIYCQEPATDDFLRDIHKLYPNNPHFQEYKLKQSDVTLFPVPYTNIYKSKNIFDPYQDPRKAIEVMCTNDLNVYRYKYIIMEDTCLLFRMCGDAIKQEIKKQYGMKSPKNDDNKGAEEDHEEEMYPKWYYSLRYQLIDMNLKLCSIVGLQFSPIDRPMSPQSIRLKLMEHYSKRYKIPFTCSGLDNINTVASNTISTIYNPETKEIYSSDSPEMKSFSAILKEYNKDDAMICSIFKLYNEVIIKIATENNKTFDEIHNYLDISNVMKHV